LKCEEDDMEIIELRERDTLAVRYRTPMAELSKSMGQAYGEVAAYMGKAGIPIAGPPFALYYNMDMDNLDVEVGFPVGGPAAGEGRVKPGRLPGGKMATATHVGSYESMAGTYEKLTACLGERGLEPETYVYEEYLNSPEDTPPEKLATNIYFPLKT
jgi:effector-binding domain-containing protein